MKLTDTKLRNAKAKDRPYKMADGGGLYIEVYPSGSKIWRFKYHRVGGGETRMSLGAYPSVTLADVRLRREELKKQQRDGMDPAFERRLERARRLEAAELRGSPRSPGSGWHRLQG